MQLKNLNTKFLGKKIFYHSEIDSTQKEIWRKIDKIENGSIVLADVQTSGIGTHGRTWHTDEKGNIAFSAYVKTDCDIENLNGLTYKIAEIITEIFKEKYNITLDIKQPNDIYCNNKKLGGILTETKIIGDKIKFIVLGIGINLNKNNFSDDIKDIATSIKKEFGIEVNSLEFISEFCNKFEIEIIKRIGE